MMEYPAHVRDISSIGRSHSSACFFCCNIAIIGIHFFLALCPSFPSSTSLCRFSSRSLVVVEFIVFPKIIWHILIGTWPSCTFRSRLCWFQRSWQQEAFYFSLFQINYSGVPPQNWIKSRLFLFWLSFIIPSLIAHLQFNYIALLPRNAEKKCKTTYRAAEVAGSQQADYSKVWKILPFNETYVKDFHLSTPSITKKYPARDTTPRDRIRKKMTIWWWCWVLISIKMRMAICHT